MNGIVLIALRRPLTFVVMSILIVLFGGLAVLRTPTDIFPNIRIPVVAVVWTYNGLSPQAMSGRVIYYYERSLTTTVGNIEHIESQSYYGRGVVKIFFQPGTDVAAAQAQITAVSQTVLKQMPAGITPPQVLSYNPSSVPVLDLQVAASGMTAAQVYDMASNLIRPALVAVPGVAIPTPYGGASLNVEIDLDQRKLLAHGLSAVDVGNALKTQNVVLPAGDQKIGAIDYMVESNASPIQVAAFNNLPIKTVNGTTVFLRDVAYVHRGAPPQINEVLVHGKQAVLIEILKSGNASTLAVVAGVKAKLPGILRTLPPGVSITPLNDASSFVRASVDDVVQEMVTAAVLTGLVGLRPGLTIVLDVAEATARARLAQRGDAPDRYERLGAGFHARVAEGFRAIAAADPARCVVIRAEGDAATVHRAVLEAVLGRWPEACRDAGRQVGQGAPA